MKLTPEVLLKFHTCLFWEEDCFLLLGRDVITDLYEWEYKSELKYNPTTTKFDILNGFFGLITVKEKFNMFVYTDATQDIISFPTKGMWLIPKNVGEIILFGSITDQQEAMIFPCSTVFARKRKRNK